MSTCHSFGPELEFPSFRSLWTCLVRICSHRRQRIAGHFIDNICAVGILLDSDWLIICTLIGVDDEEIPIAVHPHVIFLVGCVRINVHGVLVVFLHHRQVGEYKVVAYLQLQGFRGLVDDLRWTHGSQWLKITKNATENQTETWVGQCPKVTCRASCRWTILLGWNQSIPHARRHWFQLYTRAWGLEGLRTKVYLKEVGLTQNEETMIISKSHNFYNFIITFYIV